MAERDRIEERRERAEPILRLERCVVEEIAGVAQGAPLTWGRGGGGGLWNGPRPASADDADGARSSPNPAQPRPHTSKPYADASFVALASGPGSSVSSSGSSATAAHPASIASIDLGDLLGVGARRRERPQLHHFGLGQRDHLVGTDPCFGVGGREPAASTIASVFFCVFVQIASAFSM